MSEGEAIAGLKTHFLGTLRDDATLRLVYSLSHAFIAPSLAENLSNAIMEALSCGTPVVAFDIGGNGDLITHKKNGYLAKRQDSPPPASAKAPSAANPSDETSENAAANDLARGIAWILETPDYETIALNARQSVLEKFESSAVAARYVAAYNDIIGGGN